MAYAPLSDRCCLAKGQVVMEPSIQHFLKISGEISYEISYFQEIHKEFHMKFRNKFHMKT